ncbi:MAG: hypothetical protein KAR16_12110 [Bacteroidales bacterium]|nr:hypothetical protein [Bacteroidales bacterium]
MKTLTTILMALIGIAILTFSSCGQKYTLEEKEERAWAMPLLPESP